MMPFAAMRLRALAEAVSDGGGGYNAETLAWIAGISGLGGTVTTQEKDWADALIVALQGETYDAKVVWLAPFLGTNVAAHRVPLRDLLAVGPMLNGGATGFVDADCTNAGIENATEKAAYFDTHILPQDVNSNDIGFGWWEGNIGFGSNVEPMGCYDSAGGNYRGVIDLRTTVQRGSYGFVSNGASVATTAANGHYYFQSTGTSSRKLFKDGVLIASNTTADTGFSSGNIYTMFVMGSQDHTGTAFPWKGRGLASYVTDGGLSDADAAAFHTLLDTYLITPTGR